jgi:hypothetical protein
MLTLRVIPMLMVIIYLLLLFYWVFLEVNHLITFVISCTEFKLRIGNFSTNAQLLLPAPRSPAILTSNLDSQQLITPSTPSPEPGTIVPLLGLGLGALASRGKKQG